MWNIAILVPIADLRGMEYDSLYGMEHAEQRIREANKRAQKAADDLLAITKFEALLFVEASNENEIHCKSIDRYWDWYFYTHCVSSSEI